MRGIPSMYPAKHLRQNELIDFRPCPIRCSKAVLMLVLLISTSLLAKTPTGTITGTVKTEAGAAIPHAKVIARSSSGQAVASTPTDDGGRFRFPPFRPGTYKVEVEFQGQLKTSPRTVVVKEGGHAVLNFVTKAAREGPPDKSDVLGPVSFYNRPDFRQGGLKDPSGGGGYSSAASTQAVKILHQYLAPPASSAPAKAGNSEGNPVGASGSHRAELEQRGSALLERKDYAQAAKVFEEATALYPRSARLRMGLGLSLYGAGKYPQAAGALREAARLAPDDPAPVVMLAETLQFVQDPAAAGLLKHFSKLHPQNARGHYAYGLSLWRGFRTHHTPETLAGARAEFEKAVALDPDDADARLQLGMIYDEQSTPSRAVVEYLAAIRANPRLATAHYRLARDYERLGEKSKAAAEFAQYEKLRGQISP